MRFSFALKTGFVSIAILAGAFCARAQSPETANKDASSATSKGLPPRVAASEYQAQGQAGAVTIGAEFTGHSVPTPEGTYASDDFVVVEIGLFGAPQSRASVSLSDFSLRINGKKNAVTSQPYEFAFKSLKDPEWEPPSKPDSKSKTSFGSGGGNNDLNATPAPVHMPNELRRAMELRVQRAAFLEGDRPLPEAGLLFFGYHGKADSIHSVELIYSGSAGNVTIPLHP